MGQTHDIQDIILSIQVNFVALKFEGIIEVPPPPPPGDLLNGFQ